MKEVHTGEKPGIGTYKCKTCGQIVKLDDVADVMPPCPKCRKTIFIRIED